MVAAMRMPELIRRVIMTLDSLGSLWFVVYLAMLVAAIWYDVAVQRIPNWAVMPGAVVAVGLAALPSGSGVGNAMAGLAIGFAVLLPFYLLRIMGAGDVKLLAAVGAFVGFPGVLGVALLAFLAGGILSIAWAIRFRIFHTFIENLRSGLFTGLTNAVAGNLPRPSDFPVSGVRIPYAIAIAIGAVTYGLIR